MRKTVLATETKSVKDCSCGKCSASSSPTFVMISDDTCPPPAPPAALTGLRRPAWTEAARRGATAGRVRQARGGGGRRTERSNQALLAMGERTCRGRQREREKEGGREGVSERGRQRGRQRGRPRESQRGSQRERQSARDRNKSDGETEEKGALRNPLHCDGLTRG